MAERTHFKDINFVFAFIWGTITAPIWIRRNLKLKLTMKKFEKELAHNPMDEAHIRALCEKRSEQDVIIIAQYLGVMWRTHTKQEITNHIVKQVIHMNHYKR